MVLIMEKNQNLDWVLFLPRQCAKSNLQYPLNQATNLFAHHYNPGDDWYGVPVTGSPPVTGTPVVSRTAVGHFGTLYHPQ